MRHLLSTKDLSHEEAVLLLDTTAAMAATQGREIKKLPTLRGRTVVNLFLKIPLAPAFRLRQQRNGCRPM